MSQAHAVSHVVANTAIGQIEIRPPHDRLLFHPILHPAFAAHGKPAGGAPEKNTVEQVGEGSFVRQRPELQGVVGCLQATQEALGRGFLGCIDDEQFLPKVKIAPDPVGPKQGLWQEFVAHFRFQSALVAAARCFTRSLAKLLGTKLEFLVDDRVREDTRLAAQPQEISSVDPARESITRIRRNRFESGAAFRERAAGFEARIFECVGQGLFTTGPGAFHSIKT